MIVVVVFKVWRMIGLVFFVCWLVLCGVIWKVWWSLEWFCIILLCILDLFCLVFCVFWLIMLVLVVRWNSVCVRLFVILVILLILVCECCVVVRVKLLGCCCLIFGMNFMLRLCRVWLMIVVFDSSSWLFCLLVMIWCGKLWWLRCCWLFGW